MCPRDFAKDCSAAVESVYPERLATAESNLAMYLQGCGDFGKAPCAIRTLSSWIELMSGTGIFHGSTLSYTRLLAHAGVLRWRKPKAQAWDAGDNNLVGTGMGTIVGVQAGRYVMGAKLFSFLQRRYSFLLNHIGFSRFHPALTKAMKRYDAKACKLKEDYQVPSSSPSPLAAHRLSQSSRSKITSRAHRRFERTTQRPSSTYFTTRDFCYRIDRRLSWPGPGRDSPPPDNSML
jgi:hypothetical protein